MTAIVAVKDDPQPWQYGLVYFDETDWPVPGYTEIKRVTGASASDLRRKAHHG